MGLNWTGTTKQGGVGVSTSSTCSESQTEAKTLKSRKETHKRKSANHHQLWKLTSIWKY